jgi:protein-tyrosine phosphatase
MSRSSRGGVPRLSGVVSIVLICTGNRFRSPLAEALLRSRAPIPLDVTSLGLYDLGPVSALDQALETARRLNLDISEHRARPLKGEELAEADLVLGFERVHVAAAVVEAGADRERTFTLPELVDLLEAIEPPQDDDQAARVRESLRRAHALRGELPPDAVLPEVPDPWGGTADVFARIGTQVEELCRRLVTLLLDRPAAREAPERESRRESSRDR